MSVIGVNSSGTTMQLSLGALEWDGHTSVQSPGGRFVDVMRFGSEGSKF